MVVASISIGSMWVKHFILYIIHKNSVLNNAIPRALRMAKTGQYTKTKNIIIIYPRLVHSRIERQTDGIHLFARFSTRMYFYTLGYP